MNRMSEFNDDDQAIMQSGNWIKWADGSGTKKESNYTAEDLRKYPDAVRDKVVRDCEMNMRSEGLLDPNMAILVVIKDYEDTNE